MSINITKLENNNVPECETCNDTTGLHEVHFTNRDVKIHLCRTGMVGLINKLELKLDR